MSAKSSAAMVAGPPLLLLFSLLICKTSGLSKQHEQRCLNRFPRNQSFYVSRSQSSDNKPTDLTRTDGIFEPLISRKLSELPEIRPGFNENDELLMNIGHIMQNNPDSLHGKHNISDATFMALVATAQIKVFGDIYTHRYDNYDDLRLASGPGVDQDRCISQLENLVARTDLLAKEKYRSKDVNINMLLDTWGHFPSGFMLGNTYQTGMYHECNRLKIELPDGERAPTRYCSMSLRHSDWPRIDRHDVLNIKAGICIPRACDSSVHKHKIELLMRLVEHQFRQLERGQMKFHSLYCLPDEDSPLRSMLNSPKTMATLAFLTGWLSLLIFCTYMHHSLEASSLASRDPKHDSNKLTNTNGIDAQSGGSIRFYRILSIINNAKLLFNMSKSTQSDASQEGTKLEKIVDFDCLDGIKVISMIYIITGHVIMCLTGANTREPSARNSTTYYLTNMQPGFLVNVFFTITGTLTSYITFKQNQSHKFITSPAKWAAFTVLRYLRIMPTYAVVVLYSKTLAKYMSSGPIWDYATSSLSPRRTCEQEPWSDTLLFMSNFKPPLTACIPGSWYVANDFQFFLVTPFFLALLYKRPIIGQAVLYLCALAGCLAQFWSIMTNNVVDTRPIATFASHGFKTLVSMFSHNYTRPYYRIPAYLIGLLAGYKLYQFEQAKVRFLKAKRQRQVESVVDKSTEMAPQLQEPDWSEGFKRYAIPSSLAIVTICSLTPSIALALPLQNKLAAHFSVAAVFSYHPLLFASATVLYLIPSSTGCGTNLGGFFAASFWKPLVRLSLCAMLVNVEVIQYIIQSSYTMPHYSNTYHIATNLICVSAAYLVAAITFILVEAPIRGLINLLLTSTLVGLFSSTTIKTNKDTKTS